MRNYGIDMNYELINESTVEELYRIAEWEILEKFRNKFRNITIDEDTWEPYGTGYGCVYSYDLFFETDTEELSELLNYIKDDAFRPDFTVIGNYAKFEIKITIERNDIKEFKLFIADIYEENSYSTYFSDRIDNIFDLDKIAEVMKNEMLPIINDINITLCNL